MWTIHFCVVADTSPVCLRVIKTVKLTLRSFICYSELVTVKCTNIL